MSDYFVLTWSVYPSVDRKPLTGAAGPFTGEECDGAEQRLRERATEAGVRVEPGSGMAGSPFLAVLRMPYHPDLGAAPMRPPVSGPEPDLTIEGVA